MPDMERLITDNMEKLRAYSRKIGKHNHEEVFQEACVTVMASSTYDPAYAPGPWLYRHVQAAGARYLKDRAKHASVDMDGVIHEEEPTLQVQPMQEESADVSAFLRKLDRLPTRQREVCLHLANDNTLKEAADAMGISKQAAHLYMGRARRTLGIAA